MKKSNISLPEDHLGYWLRYVSNNVAHAFSRKLATSKVTVAEWIILRHMHESGKTSPGMIAVKTGLTKGAVSKLIGRLLKKELVSCEVSTHDRRFQEIKLSAQGEKLLPQLARIADDNDEHFFKDISLQKRNDLIGFLKRIVKTHKLGHLIAIGREK